MDADPPVVAVGLDPEKGAWKAVRHGETSLAVVDDGGVFVGLVPPRRLLTMLLTEHDEDVARGFSVGVPLGRVFGRELLTGGLIGFALAVGFVPLAIFGWGDREVAIVAEIALFAACSVATLVAMSLPWVLARLGRDPAFGSGPLATVIQDLLSLLIYFSVAAAVLG